jgi:hypothetical protein
MRKVVTRFTVEERGGWWHTTVQHGIAPPRAMGPYIGLLEACAAIAALWPDARYVEPERWQIYRQDARRAA